MAPTEAVADVGVTGLATMGRNLARNLARHGHTVAVHNRTTAKTTDLLERFGSEGSFVGSESTEEFVASLRRPRTVVVMVKAGPGTDAVLDHVASLLEPGDVLVDGGNAHVADTRRREEALAGRGILLLGSGISGGEEGALHGPSIMPGGSDEAYAIAGPLLESIAAVVDGVPCCTHIGPDGAGHFVKMVHNGIEYADMQLLGEVYDVLRSVGGMAPAEIAAVLREWDAGPLSSFLVETAATVLATTDDATRGPFVDVVADAAEQKGTGRWTVQIALDLGVPVPVIAEAVFARSASGGVARRTAVRAVLPPVASSVDVDRERLVDDLAEAFRAARLVAYGEGFDLVAAASDAYDWNVDRAGVATIWRGGCIIRAALLEDVRRAYDADRALTTLLADPSIAATVAEADESLRSVVSLGVGHGVPVPAFSAALASVDGLRRERSPAALVQGMRDLFGAHTYRRVDRDGAFHREWAEDGAETGG